MITNSGNVSGKIYTIPVNYFRDDDMFYYISLRERVWWRNLRGGVPVTIRVKGKDLGATAHAIVDRQKVKDNLIGFLKLAPKYANYIHVSSTINGEINPDSKYWVS